MMPILIPYHYDFSKGSAPHGLIIQIIMFALFGICFLGTSGFGVFVFKLLIKKGKQKGDFFFALFGSFIVLLGLAMSFCVLNIALLSK